MADQTILYLLKGLEENLPTTITPGRIYYCIDTSNMYVDSDGSDGVPVRKQINALKAQYLKGVENLSTPGYHELYIDNEIISLGRKEGESLYEGDRGTAGKLSIAVGENSSAKGNNSSSFGKNTNADGLNSHAEGENSTAFGTNSHAEGYETYAEGSHSHAGGYQSRATGDGSFVHGNNVEAISNYSTVFGKFSETTPDTAFAVGNGSDEDNRSNAFAMDWNGNAKFQGIVKAADPVEDDDVTTKNYVDEKMPVLVVETQRIAANDTQSVTFEEIDNIQPYLVFYNGILLVQDEHYILELPNTIIFNGWVANEDDLITISGKQFTDINEGKTFEASRLSNKTAVGSAVHPVYFSEYGVPVPCNYELDANIAGNAATSTLAATAKKLNNVVAIGSEEKPVYFNDQGVPVACGNYLNLNAASADKLTNVDAIGSATKPVYFSDQGVPVACNDILDVGISGNAATASTAARLDSASVGSTTKPVYFNANGIPVVCNDTLDVGISGNAATATTCTGNANTATTATKLSNTSAIGSDTKPVYFTASGVPAECGTSLAVNITGSSASCTGNAATATALGTNAGSSTLPVYFSGGKPVACGTSLAVSVTGSSASCTGNAKTATTATALGTNAGSSTAPVYFSGGKPVACGSSLAVSITGSSASCTGNAKTATSATTATNATNIYSSASTAKAYILGTTTASSANHATVYNASVYTSGSVLYGAAWNDYAEYRQSDVFEAGRIVCENGDDTLSLANERLQPGAEIVSDTFGFAIGETELCKTPIAVSGRVLAYPYEDRNTYKPGDAVCAAPGGTVSKMTREEIREYPERIVGTVSAIPTYETWGENNVAVNGRIWIKVK